MTSKTVSVNGIVYDAETGKPLRVERGQVAAPRHDAATIHSQPQRSKTLNRRYVHQPARASLPQPAVSAPTIARHRKPATPTVKRSEQLSRFAAQSTQTTVATQPTTIDRAPTKHHLIQRADIRLAAKQPIERTVKPSDVLKREAIQAASAQMTPKAARQERKAARKRQSSFRRFISIASASLAILLLGGYLTYLNMPALSTRVAASQAGINATYPGYQPSGYSLSGPVAYQQGSVTMKFAANGGPQTFTLSQTRSDWDSSAALENHVVPQAGSNYITTTTGGLTIYTYGSNAVWVNSGILYSISGSTPLSNDQIQRIATSL